MYLGPACPSFHYDLPGGQFLRAYNERYNKPPIRNLITFGSQHMGISDIPGCRRFDFVCQLARDAAKRAIYGNWVQENIVQVCGIRYRMGRVK